MWNNNNRVVYLSNVPELVENTFPEMVVSEEATGQTDNDLLGLLFYFVA